MGSVPSTFATGYKYAGLGYTTAFDAAVPPLGARHAHEEFEDTPCIDKGFYVLMGNNHFVMQSLQQKRSNVGPCMTSFSLDGQTQLIKGIFDEMVRRMEEMGAAIHPSKVPASSPWCGFIEYGHDKVTPFDPEAVKLVGLDMLREAGVEILLHTFVADAIVEDNRVTGVIMANKSGLQAVKATVTVDCSADADVAARAGAAFEYGREQDGLAQPMTLFFRVSHVNDAVVEAYVAEHQDDFRPFASLVAKAKEAGQFPIPRMGVGMYKTLEPGVWRINTTRMHKLDGTNVNDMTRGEIAGREQIRSLMKFCREWLPGCEEVHL